MHQIGASHSELGIACDRYNSRSFSVSSASFMMLFKAIPKNKPTGGPQPPILGVSESLTPPKLAGGLPVYSL